MNSQREVIADPEIIAHRGGLWPRMSENTLEAFAAAADAGIEWMETDVHASADGILFAAHDADLNRIAGLSHSIRDLPADELDEVELLAGGRLPRLEALFEALPEVHWNIDVKAAHSIGPMIRFVHNFRAVDRIRLASFDSGTLRRLRTALPGVRTSTGTTETGLFALGRLPGVPDQGIAPLPPGVDALQVPVSFKRIPLVTADFVARAHRSGLVVHVWTINDESTMRSLVDLGVDGIVTDDVQLGLEVVAGRHG
ncbi:glycerophosphoryl diester phosphodiesterase [Brevibacterium siliguriense]|uniref:Glycerophosphoryl diester phosphodiesterase n=1 Tax=Brevibacterium siliguriense TaxID=1136497 RepID=A0A1H1UBE7_9MICO|nr:glycerophosphodiester phosphodiesterase family protein [Brevibacterium siliguriense]SDS69815.1 glycerophosphoryl diester phosphodiesterase [Brevibacterium siliguriense]